MSTVPNAPTARPPGSGANAPLIGLVFLLLLLGGEYYLLTERDKPAPPKAALTTSATKDSTNRKAVTNAVTNAGKTAKTRENTTATTVKTGSVAVAPAAPEEGAPLDLFGAMGAGEGADPMAGISGSVLEMAGQALDMQLGLAARAILVLVSIGLLFMQRPAAPKIGQARRVARKPAEVEKPVVILSAVLAFLGVMLLLIGQAHGEMLTKGYPAAAAGVLVCGFIAGQLRASTKYVGGRLQAEKVRRDTEYGIVLQAEGGQYVNVPNPFRGTMVLGGAGAGKTYSVGEPFLEQFIAKGMCGLVYDFKFPVLAAATQKAIIYAGEQDKLIRHRVINFMDMERTEKVNPLRPQDMPMPAYAMEYAKTILNNLNPAGAKGGDNFFEVSAEAYLTGIIWFLRNNFPSLCTIPHVVAIAVYKDFTHVLSMLQTDPRSQGLVQSIITAVESKADKQTAGIIASLQIALARLTTAELSWVLAPDESKDEGFSLDLNDPANPTILTIGNNPTLAKTFSPVISCIIAVALKLMNEQNKHPSFVVIDEGATIYVPGLEVIPATARSNKVAMLYMTQDIAQMIDAYGKDKTQVMVSNLNNQFFGKINSAETAKLVSDMVGKEDVEMVSVSSGKSQGGGKTSGGRNVSQSVSVQERQVVRVQDAYTLRQGEFIGQTVETDPNNFFKAMILRDVQPGDFPITPIAHFEDAEGVVTPAIERELAQDKEQARARLQQMMKRREQAEDERSRRFDEQRAAAKKKLEQVAPSPVPAPEVPASPAVTAGAPLPADVETTAPAAAEVSDSSPDAGASNAAAQAAQAVVTPSPVATAADQLTADQLAAEVAAAQAVTKQNEQQAQADAAKKSSASEQQQQDSLEARISRQRIEALKAQELRLVQQQHRPADSPMQRMIEENHQRIYHEVEVLITGNDPRTGTPRFPNTLRPNQEVPTAAALGGF